MYCIQALFYLEIFLSHLLLEQLLFRNLYMSLC